MICRDETEADTVAEKEIIEACCKRWNSDYVLTKKGSCFDAFLIRGNETKAILEVKDRPSLPEDVDSIYFGLSKLETIKKYFVIVEQVKLLFAIRKPDKSVWFAEVDPYREYESDICKRIYDDEYSRDPRVYLIPIQDFRELKI